MMLADVPVKDEFCIKANEAAEMGPMLAGLESMPDVFLCANDFVAVEAIHLLRGLGKKIPEDVMLCGFDDSPESRNMVPALTTIHIHTQIMAYSAAQLILSRIKEPSLDYRTMHTETYLIRRASTRD